MVLLDSIWWWQGRRFARILPRAWRWRGAFDAFMAVQILGLLSILLGRYAGFDSREWMPVWMMVVLFVWHMLILPALIVLWIAATAGWSIGRLVRLLRARPGEIETIGGIRSVEAEPAPSAALAPDVESGGAFALSRRRFLATAALATPPLVNIVGSASAMQKLSDFRIRRIDVPLAGLPAELEGLTIAHVSDVHVGDFTHGRTLGKIVEATNALRSDLVLMTGDLINRDLADLPAACDMMRAMEGRFGTFMCEGNHDLFQGRAAFERGVKSRGISLLVNEATNLVIRGREVQLLGLQWGTGVRSASRAADRGDEAIRQSLESLKSRRNPEAFQILLAHHPHALDAARQAGIPLTLSGHTHGGQLHLTRSFGFGPWMYRYWSGLYARGGSRAVISNGVGNWFPLRVNAPAEIIHLTLRHASA